MGCWINAHRGLVSIFPSNVVINFEKVTVAFFNHRAPQSSHSVNEVKINAAPPRANSTFLIANFLRTTGGDVTWGKVAIARVFTLKIVVPSNFWNTLWSLKTIFFVFWYPNSTIITQRFRHECKFRLIISAGRDAGGMDLSITRISKQGTLLVSSICGGHIATLRVC